VLVLTLAACGGGNSTGVAGAGGSGGGGTAGAGGDAGGGAAGSGGVSATGDVSGEGFVENLLVKVDDGEWTLEEGLVATLRAVVGETDTSAVLRYPDLLNDEATGVVAMALAYVENGEDGQAKNELERLLDIIVFSNAQLDAMAGEEPPSTPLELARKTAEQDCAKLYTNHEVPVPPGVSVCLEKSSVIIDGKTYGIYVPAPGLPQGGWTQQRYDETLAMINEVVPVYNGLGEMPNTNIMFSVLTDGSAGAYANQPDPDHCIITVFTGIQDLSTGDFKQFLAHELAHCFQEKTFTAQNQVPYEIVRWREEGLADHLSNVAYPANGLEWGAGPEHRRALNALAFYELSTTLFDRSYTNFLFFQYLASRLSDPGLIALVKTLPTSGTKSDQIAGLASYPGMREIHHEFVRALTDREVIDTSGIPVPYPINMFNQPTVTLTGERLVELFEPFGVSRMLLTTEVDREATVSFIPEGAVDDSARTPSADEWTGFPEKVPDACADVIAVVTTIDTNASFEIDVTEVQEVPGLCELEGTWIIDNESIDFDPSAFELDRFFGEARITFGDDGMAEVVYSGWGYRIFQDDLLDVGGIEIQRHEEFIRTTDAVGTTTYVVDGDRIEFGEFSERDYLNGTETTRYIREFNPANVVGENIDETTTDDPEGWALFAGTRTYELEGGTLRFLNPINGRVSAALIRASSANE
jgi:hypothetical protein